jgi:hypothetical protein
LSGLKGSSVDVELLSVVEGLERHPDRGDLDGLGVAVHGAGGFLLGRHVHLVIHGPLLVLDVLGVVNIFSILVLVLISMMNLILSLINCIVLVDNWLTHVRRN